MKVLTESQESKVISMYLNEDTSIKSITEEFKISNALLYKTLDKHGIREELNKSRRKKTIEGISDTQEEQIEHLSSQKFSLKEICDMLNTPAQGTYDVIRDYNRKITTHGTDKQQVAIPAKISFISDICGNRGHMGKGGK